MKVASSPMAAIEALHLDVAYVAVAKALGLPTQSYMALSDAKILDAQAGAETFASALLAGLAGVNSVSGPGMLDFLLVFSLPKLVFDDEICGQTLHFLRSPPGGRPAGWAAPRTAVRRPAPDHGAAYHRPLAHGAVPALADRRTRQPRELDEGGRDRHVRPGDRRVERRLARYRPIETDDRAVAELERIIRSGLTAQTELPFVAPAPAPVADEAPGGGRRRNPRRGG